MATAGPDRQRLLARLEEHTGSVLGMPVWLSRLILEKEPLGCNDITALAVCLLGNAVPAQAIVDYLVGSGLLRGTTECVHLREVLRSYRAGKIDHYKTWSIARRCQITLRDVPHTPADISVSARGQPATPRADLTPAQRARIDFNRREALRRRALRSATTPTTQPLTQVQRMRMLASHAAAIERRLVVETARLAAPKT